MDNFKTPIKNKNSNIVQIPASPLMKKIGFGTSVVVYELQRSPLSGKLRSPWAIKKLLSSHKTKDTSKCINERVKLESEILQKLDHPNIIGFRAFTKDTDGTNVLAMEECTSSLGDLMENRLDYMGEVPYPPKTIFKVCSDIAKALDYLHNTALILHCDIKSFNILVKLVNEEFDICKLCDFGVCLPLTSSGELDKIKACNEAEYVGTPYWAAPEILQANSKITTKADIYSYGLVIWEMLAVSPPIDDNIMKYLGEYESDENSPPGPIVRVRPPIPDVELGPEYNLILEIYFCCTAVDPSKRPTANNLVQVLEEVVDKE